VTKLLYFAWLREKLGTAEEEIDLPPACKTVGELIGWLQSRGPDYEAAFGQSKSVRCAVDQEFARADAAIAGAAEIAFFPPVTGG
jgi:molybdopterin synthase sulfur carrier subunit